MTTQEIVAPGKVVSLHYTLTLPDGEVVDSSLGGEPLSYLHGSDSIVPGLEAGLEGKAVGVSLDVTVPPEAAYGERDDEAVQVVERSAFPEGDPIEEGIDVHAVDEDDNEIVGIVSAIDGDDITIDFNHPLAGCTLHFAVEITEVRDATAEEMEHGHAHGPGGHDHDEDEEDDEDFEDDDSEE